MIASRKLNNRGLRARPLSKLPAIYGENLLPARTGGTEEKRRDAPAPGSRPPTGIMQCTDPCSDTDRYSRRMLSPAAVYCTRKYGKAAAHLLNAEHAVRTAVCCEQNIRGSFDVCRRQCEYSVFALVIFSDVAGNKQLVAAQHVALV